MAQSGLVERLRKEISSEDDVPLEREGSNASSSSSNSVDAGKKIGDYKCPINICDTKIGNNILNKVQEHILNTRIMKYKGMKYMGQ